MVIPSAENEYSFNLCINLKYKLSVFGFSSLFYLYSLLVIYENLSISTSYISAKIFIEFLITNENVTKIKI